MSHPEVTDKADERQVPGARTALVQAGGGWANLRGVAVVAADRN